MLPAAKCSGESKKARPPDYKRKRTFSAPPLTMEVVHHTLDPVAQVKDMEVDKQANGSAAQSQIGEQLGFVHRGRSGHRFYLDNDDVLHQQIDAVTGINVDTLIRDRQRDFSLVPEAPEIQFSTKARAIGAFQEASTESCVNVHRRADDVTRYFIRFHLSP